MLNEDLNKLIIAQTRHSSQYIKSCDEYLAEKEAKKATEILRDSARKELDLYRADIFSKYETSINDYLRKLNASFRLSSVTSTNNRGGSSCNYNVVINNEQIPTTANTGPSFKNTLSAGDRNTLALAFFFASLDQDKNQDQKIVVIDDPMTSLDEHRTMATIHEIRDLITRVNQVIIMSHSKSFLCELWNSTDKNNKVALKIIRSGEGSIIEPWNVHQDCITEHDKRHKMIHDYTITSHSHSDRNIATALRPTLECFLRVAYPIYFPPGTLLGQFHNSCIQSLESGKPILSESDTIELKRLISYANKFHHDTNAAHATEFINDQELLDYCKRTLKFTQKG